MSAKIVPSPCSVPELDGDCWEWIGAIQSRGYGSFAHEGRTWSTHRLAYELLVGPIPDGLQVDHLCFNKRCCNPTHLEPVTGKVNCERTERARKVRCVHGHPLVSPNLIIKPRP
ncbi:HNH endonuclease signature motif containing protein, partial [Mycobacterium asiaticum]|uniref:HNH endonuclease signature motif containing protein n=1 Tax=Mycobacterium asiaticum TaxID=1790 RepID=UPI0009BDF320